MAQAQPIVEQLKAHGVTDVVFLPDNASKALLDLLAGEASIELRLVTREGEAFALAAGLWVGGRTPVVLIQNTGLLESGDALRGTAQRMRVPLVCLITYRFASGDSAMAHAADFALGIALAQPSRKVLCLNGDGSMVMSLGTLVTVAEAEASNLVLFVLENGTYEVTGNQKVPGAGRIDFAAMARAAGFARVYAFDDARSYDAALSEVLGGQGPVFVGVKMSPGSEGPLSRNASEAAAYLRPSLAESARLLRNALAQRPYTPS